ncbi:MAG: DNA polymerase I [Alphaproteobacteria bacterium]|nr:DNA polymerase I [Alphaproteobacteria bacterium]
MTLDNSPDSFPPLPRHVYLVDGSGFIFRAFHALPPLTRSDGTPVGAVHGFVAMLLKLIEETDADHIGVIFDAARRTFRNDIYPAYKANRAETPPDLVPQFALIRDATRAANVACIEMEGFEADDLIATYARQAVAAGARVTIVSGDKDLMQLVSDDVALFDPLKGRTMGRADVIEKFGVGPERVIDVQALAGDSTDNVPGVPGIGVKTAAALIQQFGDLDTVLARAGEVPQARRRQVLLDHADDARLSRELVRLRDDVPVPEPLSAMAKRPMVLPVLISFLKAQTFRQIVARLEKKGGGGSPPPIPLDFSDDAGGLGDAPRPPVLRYELLQTLEALDRWIADARDAGVVAVDTETDSLDSLNANLVGVSLAVAPGRACYIPLRHRAGQAQGTLDFGEGTSTAGGDATPVQIPIDQALAHLRPLLEDAGVLKVGHNIKFDLHVLHTAGCTVTPLDCTMLMSYVLDSGSRGHGMDELAQRHLGLKTVTFSEVCGTGKNQITFDRVPLDKACDYAAEDADVTLRLHLLFKKRLLAERLLTVHETLERPLVPVLAAMEQAGIRVDEAELRRLSTDFAGRMATLEREIHRLAGRTFNVASPKQLGEILFEEMSLTGARKSAKSGAYTTDAAVLEQLAAAGHDLPARVLDWRQLAKLKSTYTDALMAQIDRRSGRVHTSFSQTVTSTGRLSSNEPNLQNIPIRTEEGRKIRRAFIAAPGHVLLSADYSQIELRLVAHVAGIAALKEAFHHGADIHAITASQVFGVPLEGIDPALRRRAKAINFGIIYGISPFGLAAQLGIPQSEAKAYIDAYFARYPEILAYMERTKELARTHGFVFTPFGRKCYTTGIKDKNAGMRGFAERAAINAPIQGGAADIIKRAMIRMPSALADRGLTTRMLLQVHDELVFEVPETETETATTVIREVMEGAAVLSVPLVVDIGMASNWADAH